MSTAINAGLIDPNYLLAPMWGSCGTSLDARQFAVEKKSNDSTKTLPEFQPLFLEPPSLNETNLQRVRFRAFQQYRKTLLSVLYRLEPIRARYEKFLNCGRNAWVEQSPSSGHYRLRMETCKLRACPACRDSNKDQAMKNFRAAFKNVEPRYLKFITLTLKHSNQPLRDQLDHLRKSLRRLRQRNIWRSCVDYAYAVIEIKWSPKSTAWHPHVHLLARSHYIPQRRLSKEWAEVSGGSPIVDIRAVKSGAEAVDYIGKYVSKPMPTKNVPNLDEKLAEWYFAIRHSKLVLPLGNCPKPSDAGNEVDSDDQIDDWEVVGNLNDILAQAWSGNLRCQNILHQVGMGDVAKKPP